MTIAELTGSIITNYPNWLDTTKLDSKEKAAQEEQSVGVGVALQRNGILEPYYLVIDVNVPF